MLGVARNDIFLRRYLKQSYRSLQHNVNNLGTWYKIFVHSLLELLADSVLNAFSFHDHDFGKKVSAKKPVFLEWRLFSLLVYLFWCLDSFVSS